MAVLYYEDRGKGSANYNPVDVFGSKVFGDTQEDLVRKGNQQRMAQAEKGQQMLSAESLAEQFRGLQDILGPSLNQISLGNLLAAQTAAGGMQAGLRRMGLGNTGLGMALGGGLQAGATFQTNQLRARMLQDLLNSAIQTNTARGSFMAGVPIQVPEMSGHAENFQRVGQAIEIVGGMYGKPKNTP